MRERACRECANCVRSDCGKCSFCLDMPKFGGPCTKKKPCVHRRCLELIRSRQAAQPSRGVAQASTSQNQIVSDVALTPVDPFAIGMQPSMPDEISIALSHTDKSENITSFPINPSSDPAPDPTPCDSTIAVTAELEPTELPPSPPPPVSRDRPKSQRRSAGLASAAWQAIRENDRSARREAMDADALLRSHPTPSRPLPISRRKTIEALCSEAGTQVGGGAAGCNDVMEAALTEEESSEDEVEVDCDESSDDCGGIGSCAGLDAGSALLELDYDNDEHVTKGGGCGVMIDRCGLDGQYASEESEMGSAERAWIGLELRCALSLQRLTDPAKGEGCQHPPRCNYLELREYVGRRVTSGIKECPIVGCVAPLQRTRGVVRDEQLRNQLLALPPHISKVWLRGDELRTVPPGTPTGQGWSGISTGTVAQYRRGKAFHPTRQVAKRKRRREDRDVVPSNPAQQRGGRVASNLIVLE